MNAAAAARRHALPLAFAAAIALSFVLALDALWRDKIEFNRRRHESTLLKETLAGAKYDHLQKAELSAFPAAPAEMDALWIARLGGRAVAAAARARAAGYGGDIVFIAAFSARGRLLQMRIVRHSETPGIADFLSRKDGGIRAIDGESGATITSVAAATTARKISAWIRYNISGGDGGLN